MFDPEDKSTVTVPSVLKVIVEFVESLNLLNKAVSVVQLLFDFAKAF